MRSFLITAAALAATMTALPAQAGTATGQIPVSATLLESCTVVATPMLFGILPTVGQADIDTSASVNLVCTLNADYEVALDDGANAVGGVRRMKNLLTNDYISYQIFRDAAHTQPWGHQSGVNTLADTAPLGLKSYTAYGRIPTGTTGGAAGIYTDLVTVSVNF